LLRFVEELPVKASDKSSGKWRRAVPEIAASLLVNLSARLLQWQNPGEVCGDLLQLAGEKWATGWDTLRRKLLLIAQSLRDLVTAP